MQEDSRSIECKPGLDHTGGSGTWVRQSLSSTTLQVSVVLEEEEGLPVSPLDPVEGFRRPIRVHNPWNSKE